MDFVLWDLKDWIIRKTSLEDLKLNSEQRSEGLLINKHRVDDL